MSHVVEQAAVGRQPAPPPTSSGAQQVLRGLGQQPSIPWNQEEHVASRAGAEQYLRNHQGGGGLHHTVTAQSAWLTSSNLLYTRCVYVIAH